MIDSIDQSFKIKSANAFVFRSPVKVPVETSFGVMYDRPAVILRLEDEQGNIGWGEIWCNFPSVGAEHRARLFEATIVPHLIKQAWKSPAEFYNHITKSLRVLAIQCGEPGTIAQAIAGTDIALWDFVARRAKIPLWKLLGGDNKFKVYASGINPDNPEKLVGPKIEEGYKAFKLKVGFGRQRDMPNLQSLKALLSEDMALMIDANQAWTLQEAIEHSKEYSAYGVDWLEEPIAADSSIDDWAKLEAASPIPLAAGENMRGHAQFNEAITSGIFSFLQPDIAKWGGFTDCVPLGLQIRESSALFCPHWLGSGMGLMATMHLKAAVGGDGYVEIDANHNPLRDLFTDPDMFIKDGVMHLSDAPGLGVSPDLDKVAQYRVQHKYN